MLITPTNHFVTHFYEASVLQDILAENPQAPQNMKEKI